MIQRSISNTPLSTFALEKVVNYTEYDGAHKRFRVIHPFHPLHGQEFELLEYRNNWGEDRVCFEDAEGRVRSILANCTDAGGIDPFVEISRGRSWFRYEDLVRLADLVEACRQCGVK